MPEFRADSSFGRRAKAKAEDEIAADMNFLSNLWLDIRQKAEKKPAPVLLHHDLDIVQRILRDQFTEPSNPSGWTAKRSYESILRFVQRFQPALVNRGEAIHPLGADF